MAPFDREMRPLPRSEHPKLLRRTERRRIGKDKKLYVPFPYLPNFRDRVLATKLMQLNYTHQRGHIRTIKEVDWAKWYEAVEWKRTHSSFNEIRRYCHRTRNRCPENKVFGRRKRIEVAKSFISHGVPKEQAYLAANYAQHHQESWAWQEDVLMGNSSATINPGNANLQDCFKGIWPSLKTADVQKALNEVSEEEMEATIKAIKEKKTPRPRERSQGSGDGPAQTEFQWQRKNWARSLLLENWRPELNEIWYQRRILKGQHADTLFKYRLVPKVAEVLVQILRTSLFHQEWFKVAKAIEGLANEASGSGVSDHTFQQYRHWILWNAGFYSIIRFEKDTGKAAELVLNFAKNFCAVFSPTCYNRRLGVEIAIWLTQEGKFNEGLEIMKELETHARNYVLNKSNPFYDNVKRDLVDFLFQLILSVKCYAEYKVLKGRSERETLSEREEEGLRFSAQVALSSFESLLEPCLKCEGEVSAFLPQLLELTVALKGVGQGKELLQDLVVKYYGNQVVEAEYKKFLSQHFPQDKAQVCKELKLVRNFGLDKKKELPSQWHHQGRALSAFREKRKERLSKVGFKPLPRPGFTQWGLR